jgi:hypothetical protein
MGEARPIAFDAHYGESPLPSDARWAGAGHTEETLGETVRCPMSMTRELPSESAVSNEKTDAISAHASVHPGGNALTRGWSVAPPCRAMMVDDDPLVPTRISTQLNPQ